MGNKLTYHQGEIDGARDFNQGERENINHLPEVTNKEYACGYEAGWKQARDEYEIKGREKCQNN